ncbi:MAG: hypothetical protein EHM49_00215 [Deltaproteobacteria bacterium]|nr:MAG: hypothetical protein EHM49_00215 [Deltaproteobacteria bacterium]
MTVSINDLADFTTKVSLEMGGLSGSIGVGWCDQASDKTIAEFLGEWTYPITDAFKVYWFLERGKRHLMQIFLIESAKKFKYKQINLQHRFEHYFKLLELMDKQFLEAAKDNPALFPVPDGGWGFPDYISNTFSYDFMGIDNEEETEVA